VRNSTSNTCIGQSSFAVEVQYAPRVRAYYLTINISHFQHFSKNPKFIIFKFTVGIFEYKNMKTFLILLVRFFWRPFKISEQEKEKKTSAPDCAGQRCLSKLWEFEFVEKNRLRVSCWYLNNVAKHYARLDKNQFLGIEARRRRRRLKLDAAQQLLHFTSAGDSAVNGTKLLSWQIVTLCHRRP